MQDGEGPLGVAVRRRATPAVVEYMRKEGCPVDWERVREWALRNVSAVHPRVMEVVQREAEVVAAARGSRWWVELHREREYQRLWALGGGKTREERREYARLFAWRYWKEQRAERARRERRAWAYYWRDVMADL